MQKTKTVDEINQELDAIANKILSGTTDPAMGHSLKLFMFGAHQALCWDLGLMSEPSNAFDDVLKVISEKHQQGP